MSISRREFSLLLTSVLSSMSVARANLGNPVRVRRDINTLGALELGWFREGVAAMRALPDFNPLSLYYQSCVHGTDFSAIPGVPQADFDAYFNKCNHGGYFLSWHRWYILFWEQIVRELCGINSFNLPYWDAVGDEGFLPAAVRQPADLGTNSLYDDTRLPELNDATAGISNLDNDPLIKTPFEEFSTRLNDNPHGRIHNMMGGHMLFIWEAAQDPIFFLHHCNIDRYWECWLKQAGHQNPGAPFTEKTYLFNTPNGPRTVVAGDAMFTSHLGYKYDKCPVPPPRITLPKKIFNIVLFEVPYIELPTPDPPPPIIRTLLQTRPFALDGRSNVLVLSRSALARTGFAFDDPNASVAIGLSHLALTEAGRRGGFEIEVWLVPDAHLVEKQELQGAVKLGALGTFTVGHLAHHGGGHDEASSQVFSLSPEAKRLLGGTRDPGIVFVRRGLVDRRGSELPFDGRASLFEMEGLLIGVAR